MDDQISAEVKTVYEYRKRHIEVSYLAFCGCGWTVDMWGNVRKVRVCEKCGNWDGFEQLSVFD